MATGTTALCFSAAARQLGDEARRHGLACPGFRSPPRLPGARRTIRWSAAGPVIAIAIRDRPVGEVVVDMVEGLVVANRLRGSAAAVARRRLLAAAEPASA
jgi:hypothetical protein